MARAHQIDSFIVVKKDTEIERPEEMPGETVRVLQEEHHLITKKYRTKYRPSVTVSVSCLSVVLKKLAKI